MTAIKVDYREQHYMLTLAAPGNGDFWVNAAVFFTDGSQESVSSGRQLSEDEAFAAAEVNAKELIDKEIEASLPS